MKPEAFPKTIQPYLIPRPSGQMVYRCLGCAETFDIDALHYVCPGCQQVLLIEDLQADRLKDIPGSTWHEIFDYRKMLTEPCSQGHLSLS